MDIDATLAERGARYGQFKDHAVIAQDLQDTMREAPGWNHLAPDQKQALTVISDKIARMLNGDPNYIDNWHDIIGYSKLVETRLISEQPQSETTRVVPTITGKVNARNGAVTLSKVDFDTLMAAAGLKP